MGTAFDFTQWDRLCRHLATEPPSAATQEWSYCGLDIWPVVRTQILSRARSVAESGWHNELYSRSSAGSLGAWPNTGHARQRVAHALADLPSFAWPSLPDHSSGEYILCLGDGADLRQVGGAFFHFRLDPLRSALALAGHSSTTLLTGLSDEHARVVRAGARNVRGIERQYRAVRGLSRGMPSVGLSGYAGFAAWWNKLRYIFDGHIPISIERLETAIRVSASSGYWFYENFTRSRPSAVLLAIRHNPIAFGASWACRRLGVPVADIQHAATNRRDYAYSWPNSPASGFNTLPTIVFPWSTEEVGDIRGIAQAWKPRLFPVGNCNRLFEELIATRNTVATVLPRQTVLAAKRELKMKRDDILRLKRRVPGDRDILIALDRREQAGWLPRLKALTPANWRIWVRVHPSDFEANDAFDASLAGISDHRTFVAVPSSVPLPVILREVDIVLTKHPSIAFDAKAYGVPTIAYSKAARIHYGDPEFHRVRYVAPYAEQIRAALGQRLSVYRHIQQPVQEIEPLIELGQRLSTIFLTK